MGPVLRRWFWYWGPPLVWMGGIFFFSAQPDLPQAPGPWLDMLLKKTGHTAAYGVLAWLYLRVLRRHLGNGRSLTVFRVASIGLAVAYALSDEYHQTFVPGRDGNLLDVVVDGAGACVAMLLDRWLARRRALSGPGPRSASVAR